MTLIAGVWDGVIRVPENRSALRGARRLAQGIEARNLPFTPLVLHGPTGCGKSAITSVMMTAVATDGRTARLLYANDLDPRASDHDDLFEATRDCDLIIIEDLQHLPERSAEWLQHLLDDRHQRRKATVLTANVGPAALTHLPRRLTSRLVAGLVLPIDPLSATTRRKLLIDQAQRRQLHLTPDAVRWLADLPTGGGLRPLLGMLDTLKATTRGQSPSTSGFHRIDRATVERLFALHTTKSPNFETIVLKVAAAFDVKSKELLGPSRLRTVVLARQVAMYLAHEVAGFSLPSIGRALDRDHTTVLHSVRKIRDLMTEDRTIASTIRQLTEELQ